MADYPAEKTIRHRYELLEPVLDERLRRFWAAAEALALGAGGVSIASRATGLSRSTIRLGIQQLREPDGEWIGLTRTGRVRNQGAGRKRVLEKKPGIEQALESLMESRQGGELGPLAWTCKSLRSLADELGAIGHPVSYRTIGNLLHRLGYSLGRPGDYNRSSPADRRESFCRIARTAAAFLGRGEPVLSVQFRSNPGAVGIPHLLHHGLLGWWRRSGLQLYPRAQRILLAVESAVTGEGWTAPLEALAAEIRLGIIVDYLPAGAWRWQRSVRQVTCRCSFPKASAGADEISTSIDRVLPDVGSS